MDFFESTIQLYYATRKQKQIIIKQSDTSAMQWNI